MNADWTPQYSRWRHGGWYVDNVRYPSGAVGCVSRDLMGTRWQVVCQPQLGTYRTRDDAARAERAIASNQCPDCFGKGITGQDDRPGLILPAETCRTCRGSGRSS